MTQRERYLLTGVRVCLALVCLIPLVVSYTTVFPFVVGKSLLARSLVEIAFAGWLLLAWRVPEYRPRPSVILLALLAWLGVSTLAALLGVNVGRSLWSGYERMHGVVELAHWCGFILVAASVFRTFPAWQALLGAHLAVGAAVSALGLAGYLGLVGWVWVFSEVARAGSTLGSGLFLGAYAAMNAGFGVALLLCPWRDHWRWRGAWDPVPGGGGGGVELGGAVDLGRPVRAAGGGGDGAGVRRRRAAAGPAPDGGRRRAGGADGVWLRLPRWGCWAAAWACRRSTM